MPNNKIVVTGGAGFIGSNLVDALIERDEKVIVVDNLSSGKKENLNPKAKFIKHDLREESTRDLFTKLAPKTIYHLAAQKSVPDSVKDPFADLSINLVSLLNIMEGIKSLDEKPKVIFSSTGGAIYGDTTVMPTPESLEPRPASPYGITKLASEKYLHFYKLQYGVDYSVLRFANVYGPRQDPKGEAGVVAIFVSRAFNKEPMTIYGDGKNTRDYVYVGDVVEACLKAKDTSTSSPINVGTGQETSVLEITAAIHRLMDHDITVRHDAARPGEQRRSLLDNSLGKKDLGFEPAVDLEKGIKMTIDWFASNKTSEAKPD